MNVFGWLELGHGGSWRAEYGQAYVRTYTPWRRGGKPVRDARGAIRRTLPFNCERLTQKRATARFIVALEGAELR